VYGGEIDDPYSEFLIQEKKEVKKESLQDGYQGAFWRDHYVLRSTIPTFLAASSDTIRTTGKYLNAIRECGEQIQVGRRVLSYISSIPYLHIGKDMGGNLATLCSISPILQGSNSLGSVY
jgi:hypothetical protein